MPHTPRRPRIAAPGAAVRISSLFGQLMNISETGALVRTGKSLTIGGEWPLVLCLPNCDEPLQLRARVVRLEPVQVDLPGATWRHQDYALGLMFTFVPPKAREALEQLCTALGATGLES